MPQPSFSQHLGTRGRVTEAAEMEMNEHLVPPVAPLHPGAGQSGRGRSRDLARQPRPQGPRLQGLLTVHSFQPLGLQRPRALPSWNQAEALDKELPPPRRQRDSLLLLACSWQGGYLVHLKTL